MPEQPRDFDQGPPLAFNRANKITYPSIWDPTGSVLVALFRDVVDPALCLNIWSGPPKTETVVLGSIAAAVLGLCLSLFVRPRRVWVRVRE